MLGILLIFTCLLRLSPCRLLPLERFGGGRGVVVMKQDKLGLDKLPAADAFSFVVDSIRGKKVDRGDAFVGECLVCAKGIGWIQGLLRDGLSYEEVARKVETRCRLFHIETPEVCHGIVTLFKDVVLDVLSRTKLTPYEVCDVITESNCSGHSVPSMEWVIDIPERSTNPAHRRTDPKTNGVSGEALRVLHLADIHVDFKYRPFSEVSCNQPLCCRDGKPGVFQEMAGLWGTLGKCDLPVRTVDDLFQRLSKEKFDYIILTGDLLSHSIWNQTKEEQLEVLGFLVDLFVKYFPRIPIYPALGNHEGIPVNNFPQHSVSAKESVDWLYQALSKTWSEWTADDVQLTVKRGAFYTVMLAPKFRIISLNMNFCNNFNWWLMLDSKDPESELKWLVSVLQRAEENGERVHIIGHIPPGIPDCLKAWSWNYYRIVNRYNEIIAGQFFGHLHHDSFQLFYDDDDSEVSPPTPTSVAYLAPSVTTYVNLNPGYRVYEVDGHRGNGTWSVLDHHTYIMDMEKTRKVNKPVWVHEYSAKKAYGMEKLSPVEWHRAVERMKTNESSFDTYRKLYYKSNPIGSCGRSCRWNMICSLVSGRSYDDAFCKDLVLHDDDNGSNNSSKEPFRYSDYVRWQRDNKLC